MIEQYRDTPPSTIAPGSHRAAVCCNAAERVVMP